MKTMVPIRTVPTDTGIFSHKNSLKQFLFALSYETGNGISAEEEGHLKNAGSEETEALEVRGSYKYTAPDGTLVSVTYIANENGFQPQGTHISAAGIARNPQETRQRAETPAQPQTTSEQPETAQTSGEEAAAAVNGEVASEAEASLFRPVYRARAQFRRF